MKILWFPRLQADIDRFHIRTWYEMCSEISNDGHQVKLAVAGVRKLDNLKFDAINIPIIRIKYLRLFSFWLNGFIKFIYHYFVFKPDVLVLTIFTFWFAIPIFVFRKNNRPVVIFDSRNPYLNMEGDIPTLRNTFMSWYVVMSLKYVKKYFSGVSVITEFYKERICNAYGFKKNLVCVWSSGVNLKEFIPLNAESELKPSFVRNRFVLMQHGEISSNRGVLKILEALSILKKNNDICFVMIGSSLQEKFQKVVFRKINEYGLNDCVYVLPPVMANVIPKHLSYCDCGLMPYPNIDYWNMNNPIKLLEYLAMGKPVIATDMYTFRSVMGNSKCAIYLRNNEPECLAAAISFCYNNRFKLREWGETGRKIVEDGFSWKQQSKKLVNFLQERFLND